MDTGATNIDPHSTRHSGRAKRDPEPRGHQHVTLKEERGAPAPHARQSRALNQQALRSVIPWVPGSSLGDARNDDSCCDERLPLQGVSPVHVKLMAVPVIFPRTSVGAAAMRDFFFNTLFIPLSVLLLAPSAASAQDAPSEASLVQVAHLAGRCGALQAAVDLQSAHRSEEEAGFVLRLWSVEAARLGWSAEELHRVCQEAVPAYQEVRDYARGLDQTYDEVSRALE
jgi:hypothetical protein